MRIEGIFHAENASGETLGGRSGLRLYVAAKHHAIGAAKEQGKSFGGAERRVVRHDLFLFVPSALFLGEGERQIQ